MKKIFYTSFVLLGIAASLYAQPERVGVGLAFAQKVRFNNGDTGNPGINLKTWISLGEEDRLYLVPSVTAFNPGRISKTSHWVTNYRFHGDLDIQYLLYHEKTLKLTAFAGVNYSYMSSTNEIIVTPPVMPVDSSLYGFGPSLGASLEMRMHSFWDFIVSARYTAASFNPGSSVQYPFFDAPLTGLIIQVHAVYYFYGRRKGYR